MAEYCVLSPSEFAALTEVGRGVWHKPIPPAEREKLLQLRLIYRLLGEDRITHEGRARAALGLAADRLPDA